MSPARKSSCYFDGAVAEELLYAVTRIAHFLSIKETAVMLTIDAHLEKESKDPGRQAFTEHGALRAINIYTPLEGMPTYALIFTREDHTPAPIPLVIAQTDPSLSTDEIPLGESYWELARERVANPTPVQ